MKYNIRGNKIDVTAAIEDYIKQKISKVEKYFNESAEAKAIISAKGKDQKVEVREEQKEDDKINENVQNNDDFI